MLGLLVCLFLSFFVFKLCVLCWGGTLSPLALVETTDLGTPLRMLRAAERKVGWRLAAYLCHLSQEDVSHISVLSSQDFQVTTK